MQISSIATYYFSRINNVFNKKASKSEVITGIFLAATCLTLIVPFILGVIVLAGRCKLGKSKQEELPIPHFNAIQIDLSSRNNSSSSLHSLPSSRSPSFSDI